MKFLIETLSNLGQKLTKIFSAKNTSQKTLADYNREALIKQGADQFRKIIEKGLTIPVAH